MAPSNVRKRCTCKQCLQQNPDGILMEAWRIPVHLNRIKNERSNEVKIVSSPAPPPQAVPSSESTTEEQINDMTSHLFALTLMDEGPDPDTTASKLWNSRASFQQSGTSNRVITGVLNPILPADIASSLNRLVTREPTSSSPDPLVSSPNCTSKPPQSHSSQRDRNQCSKKALQLLDNVNSRVQRCYRLLLESSDDHLSSLRDEVVALR